MDDGTGTGVLGEPDKQAELVSGKAEKEGSSRH